MKKWIILISIVLGADLCILSTGIGTENILLCLLIVFLVDFMIIGEFFIDFYKGGKKDE